MDFQALFI